jgi:5-methylthioadenosine/S-adenosylhomocysteine deaminase
MTNMTTVIRDGFVITCDRAGQRWARADVVLEGSHIRAVGPGVGANALAARPDAVQIDASRMIVLPGLVNAHMHSNEAFEQGAYDQLPLEAWLASAYPPTVPVTLDARTHYLRAMLVAAQSIRCGVTSVQDDVLNPGLDQDALDATMRAYRDAGLRAWVATTFVDGSYIDSLPWLRELAPADLREDLERLTLKPVAEQEAFFRDAHRRWHGGADGRLRVILAPRGPQRTSRALCERMATLATEFDVPVHMHVLETRTQAVTAQRLYGKTFVAALDEFGLLSHRMTLNHAVWLSADDVARLGAAGCSTTHNPLSNMKLGSGISPVKRLLDAGVNVGIGTDGPTTSDTGDLFEAIRAASLIHKLGDPDPAQWLGAEEALTMATLGGARSGLMEREIGSLEPGKKADVILLDRNNWGFVPLHDPVRQLAYSVTSEAVDTVIVDGRVLMQGRKILAFDESAVRAEVMDAAERFRTETMPKMAAGSDRIVPTVHELYRRGLATPLPPTVNANTWATHSGRQGE